eukprot:Rhum_TRINITY_DN13016_c2_g1::Rhum_TRINITY_DN13016_c2_g1_i1::g.56333::m.56333
MWRFSCVALLLRCNVYIRATPLSFQTPHPPPRLSQALLHRLVSPRLRVQRTDHLRRKHPHSPLHAPQLQVPLEAPHLPVHVAAERLPRRPHTPPPRRDPQLPRLPHRNVRVAPVRPRRNLPEHLQQLRQRKLARLDVAHVHRTVVHVGVGGRAQPFAEVLRVVREQRGVLPVGLVGPVDDDRRGVPGQLEHRPRRHHVVPLRPEHLPQPRLLSGRPAVPDQAPEHAVDAVHVERAASVRHADGVEQRRVTGHHAACGLLRAPRAQVAHDGVAAAARDEAEGHRATVVAAQHAVHSLVHRAVAADDDDGVDAGQVEGAREHDGVAGVLGLLQHRLHAARTQDGEHLVVHDRLRLAQPSHGVVDEIHLLRRGGCCLGAGVSPQWPVHRWSLRRRHTLARSRDEDVAAAGAEQDEHNNAARKQRLVALRARARLGAVDGERHGGGGEKQARERSDRQTQRRTGAEAGHKLQAAAGVVVRRGGAGIGGVR